MMSIFEITAAGFDATTDDTDHLVLWIEAPSPESVKEVLDDMGATFSGEVKVDADVDFTLPGDRYRLRARLKFFKAVQELDAAWMEYAFGSLSSVPHANRRESCLCTAIEALATELGAQIEGPLRIDSRGDIAVNVKRGAGGYGAALAELLNRHNPRTGIQPGAVLQASSSWCYLNHFDAERLVRDRFPSVAKHAALG